MAVGILLVGGFGTRLAPLTSETPKPMLPVAGIPVTLPENKQEPPATPQS